MRIQGQSLALGLVAVQVLAFAVPATVHSQSLKDDPGVIEAIDLLDRWIDAQRAYDQIPGLSVAIVHDQELLWSAGFGYADLESQRPATPATMYSICSISKLFTSVSAMQLRDRGEFRLDDEVRGLLPWFQLANAHPDGPPITVEGLLTHSAGIPRESDHPYWSAPFDFPTHEEVVEGVQNQETLYPAWKYFQYSNLGLTLVGEIVAEKSGQSYGDYVREHVLSPLGMESTTPEIGEVHGTDKLATGYSAMTRKGHRKKVEPFEGRGIAPAAGYASTVEDLAKFASWQFRLLETGEHELLDANTLREMQRVHYMDPGWRTSRGLGFGVSHREGKTFVGHGGSCPGYRSNFQLQMDDQIATIAMANAMINPSTFTRRAYEIIAPAVKAAKAKAAKANAEGSGAEASVTESESDEGEHGWEEQAKVDFQPYVGIYDDYPWGGESHVVQWKGSLAIVSFPTSDPMEGMTKLKYVEGHTFRRVRSDESLGEEVTFEVDEQGRVVRIWKHGNYSKRIG